tara:strand:+ start:79 stop:411 length:333 start_codon:yes stop_codon:yes gene_type:complete
MPSVEIVIGAASIGTAAVVSHQVSDFAASADEIWSMGLGPFMTLICVSLCAVVIYLWRTYRSDSREHHNQRDADQSKLMDLVIEATSTSVQTRSAISALTVEVKRLADRP